MNENKTIPGWVTDDFLAEMRRLEGSSRRNPMKDTAAITGAWALDAKHNGVGTWIGAVTGGLSYLTGAGHIALIDMAGPSRGEAAGKLTVEEEYWLLSPDGSETIHVSPSGDSCITFTKAGRYQIVLPGRRAAGALVVADRLVGVPISDISALKFEDVWTPSVGDRVKVARGGHFSGLVGTVKKTGQGTDGDMSVVEMTGMPSPFKEGVVVTANLEPNVVDHPGGEIAPGISAEAGRYFVSPSGGLSVPTPFEQIDHGVAQASGKSLDILADLFGVYRDGKTDAQLRRAAIRKASPEITLTPVPCSTSYSWSMDEIRAAASEVHARYPAPAFSPRFFADMMMGVPYEPFKTPIKSESAIPPRPFLGTIERNGIPESVVEEMLRYSARARESADSIFTLPGNFRPGQRTDGHSHGPILTGNARESYLAIQSGAPDPHAKPEPPPAEPTCDYCKDTGIGESGMRCPVRDCEAVA